MLYLGDSLKLIFFVNVDWVKVYYKNGKIGFVFIYYIVKVVIIVKIKIKMKVYIFVEGKSIKIFLVEISVFFLGWSKMKKGGFDFDWVFVDYGGVIGYMKIKDLYMIK